MAYACRLRFIAIARIKEAEEGGTSVTVPGLPKIELTMGEEAMIGRWVVAIMRGFKSEDAANQAGKKLADFLLAYGVIFKDGVDLGFSRSTLSFGQTIHDIVQKQGFELRSELHGLMTYEEGSVQIVGVAGKGVTLTPVAMFEDRANLVGGIPKLSEKQRRCAALINDSFFVGRTEARFILRISAIEALAIQGRRSQEFQDTLKLLRECLESSASPNEVKKTLNNALCHMTRQSVSEACQELIVKHTSPENEKLFKRLYALRSRLLHDGKGRGDLAQPSEDALAIVTSVFRADVFGDQNQRETP